jgi:hypothetical protein
MSEAPSDDVLRLLVVMARDASLSWLRATAIAGGSIDPSPGDLVVEVSHRGRHLDPDAIGWLIDHGQAAYREDGTGPTREVWDILPLSGRGQTRYPEPGAVEGAPSAVAIDEMTQRWENAEFRRVPKPLVSRAGLHPPTLSAA